MFAPEILRVIYSPFKAFKEILQNPKYFGPIMIMVLFISANAASVYIVLSKTHVEQTLPEISQEDEWTENQTLWTPMPEVNYDDYINGSFYGNRSLEFSISDQTFLQFQMNSTETVNCTGIEGYKNMSFRIKLIFQEASEPNSAFLFLHSSPTEYFYYNLTPHLTPWNSSIWNNITVPTGPESIGWSNNETESEWDNITKIRFEFRWPEPTNATVLLDGLFFRGFFKSELENAPSHILNFSLSALIHFTLRWVILSGILFLTSKALGSTATWKPTLIVVGFALITLFIQSVVNIGVYASLPRLSYPLEYFSGILGESEVAHNRILEQTQFVYMINNYAQLGISIWTIALCAIALQLLTEFSWTKTILISTLAYFVSMIAEILLIGY